MQRRLLPGMFATARLVTGSESLVVLPAAAIKHDGETDRVYVVAGGKAEERLVAVGARQGDGDGVAIVSGVRAGERIVAPIVAALRDGSSVH
jgi:multidrug efflux pump subunit AcrA (membrane-fusion protein)